LSTQRPRPDTALKSELHRSDLLVVERVTGASGEEADEGKGVVHERARRSRWKNAAVGIGLALAIVAPAGITASQRRLHSSRRPLIG
jgi:hypothetical protein